VSSRRDKPGPESISPPAVWLSPIRTIVLWVLTVEVGILIVTGVALFFVYRPEAAGGWNPVYGGASGIQWFPELVRYLHRWTSALALPTGFAAGVLLVIQAWATVRRLGAIVLGAALTVAIVAASVTGFLLPWDQLALWAVTVGTNMRGYRPLFGSQVRFVFVGGGEVGSGTVVRWLLVHMLVLGPAVAALVAIAWRRRRGAPRPVLPQVHPAGSEGKAG
jgi:quinol-cytochrome oxidoreductase complex cytochrome b subunit